MSKDQTKPAPKGKKPEVQEGVVLLKAPKNVVQANWGGKQYDVEDGYVMVPAQAAADLANHGFTSEDEE